MSRVIVRRSKAARIYRCERRRPECTGPIQRGQEYVREALPPGDSDIGNREWWTSRSCVACFEADEEAKYAWVRTRYDVPARRGAIVRYSGGPVPIVGEIVDVDGGQLIVRGRNKGSRFVLHPTWRVEYLTEDSGASA